MQMYLNNNLWQRTNSLTNCRQTLHKQAIQCAGDYLRIYYLRPLMPTEKQALTVGRRLKIYQDKQPR